jgi:branched-subunit amino acid ABC-type transport system permease component
MHYFLVILTSGLLAGIMYAMVAIGFVLIYKASGVFNFAQGSLVLFAALSFVTLTERGLPFWLAFLVTSWSWCSRRWSSNGSCCGRWSIAAH